MSDTPEYMLKPGVTISDDILLWGPNMVAITVRDKQGIYQGSIGRELFERAFVPLDRQALREQVDKLSIRIAHDLQVEDISWDETRSIIEQHVYDEVLALFGLHNTGETQ